MEEVVSTIKDMLSEGGKGKELHHWQLYEHINGYMKQCALTLYEKRTLIFSNGTQYTLLLNKDVVGAKIKDIKGESCYIEISTMPIVDFKENIRKIYTYTYWVNSLKKARNIVGWFCDIALGKQPQEEYKELPPKTANLLVLINPFSWAGRAVKNWEKMKVMLEKFHLDFEVKTTEYAGHARDIANKEDLSRFTGLVTVSGDGLIHEIINGFMLRENKEDYIPTIGFLPGGTSDGFVKSILHESNEGYSLENAVYCVGRGFTKKIDLIELQWEDSDTPIYSFLSVCWAMVADVDLESEVLRCLGDLRLIIWGLLRCIFLRKYEVKYQISNEEGVVAQSDSRKVVFLTVHNSAFIDKKIHIVPPCETDDGYAHMLLIDGKAKTLDALKVLTELENIPFFRVIETENTDSVTYEEKTDSLDFEYYKGKEFKIEPDNDLVQSFRNSEHPIKYGRFSIDGEPYPADRYSGKVLPKILKVFCPLKVIPASMYERCA